MPVEPTIVNSRLVLRLETDVDEQGNSIVTNRSFNAINTEANDENVKAIAEALATLQMHPLVGIIRINENQLG